MKDCLEYAADTIPTRPNWAAHKYAPIRLRIGVEKYAVSRPKSFFNSSPIHHQNLMSQKGDLHKLQIVDGREQSSSTGNQNLTNG